MQKQEKELLNFIGKRVKELRLNAGYSSQENFAYDAEIPRAQYGRYEKGVNITLLSLQKILKFHNLSMEEFFKGCKTS